jgi:BolA protein
MKEIIAKKLQELEPIMLEVVDESHLHAGHAGARAGGESHFSVKIASKVFENKNKVLRHKMIYALLREELKSQIHALSLSTMTLDELNER